MNAIWAIVLEHRIVVGLFLLLLAVRCWLAWVAVDPLRDEALQPSDAYPTRSFKARAAKGIHGVDPQGPKAA